MIQIIGNRIGSRATDLEDSKAYLSPGEKSLGKAKEYAFSVTFLLRGE
jgi:hypothetical protein